MSDKFPGLPDIPPDPNIQLESWDMTHVSIREQTLWAQSRKAFIQMLITRYAMTSVAEIQEGVRRRFGSAPTHKTILRDLRELKAVRIPMPSGGFRYKLASQIGDVNIEEEFDERVRVDVLSLQRKDHTVHLEMNRGTTMSLVQILNLMVDDGLQPYILSISTDTDKWITIHFLDGRRALNFEEWMKPKIY